MSNIHSWRLPSGHQGINIPHSKYHSKSMIYGVVAWQQPVNYADLVEALCWEWTYFCTCDSMFRGARVIQKWIGLFPSSSCLHRCVKMCIKCGAWALGVLGVCVCVRALLFGCPALLVWHASFQSQGEPAWVCSQSTLWVRSLEHEVIQSDFSRKTRV